MTCGDGLCNNNETVSSCPLDCCPTVNPLCANNSATCNTPICCGDSSCCLNNDVEPPIGTVIDWFLPSTFPYLPLPSGYEICDGTAVTTYGSILLGVTKPDLRGVFVQGVADPEQIGRSGGSSSTTSSSADNHVHSISNGADMASSIVTSGANPTCQPQPPELGCLRTLVSVKLHSYNPPPSTASGGAHAHTVSTVPPYVGLLKLIRVL